MGKVLGVTGGIATGKSTVVAFFKELGYPVVDGDLVAREVVEPGREGLAAVVKVFGQEILLEDGQLDRKKLGMLIFSSDEKRKQLDQVLGPYLRKEIVKQIELERERNQLVIADIPLLYEYQYETLVDQVAVVYIPEKLQLKRLMARNHLTKAEALERIQSQWPIELKKAMGDTVFDNQGTVRETQKQVTEWLASFFEHVEN